MKIYMSKVQNCCLSGAVLLALFFTSAVQADIVTFQFEGELVGVDNSLGGEFSVGDHFKGNYSFNTDSADPQYYDFTGFVWGFPDAILSMTMSFSRGGDVDYYTSSATNGSFYEDFEDDPDYWVGITPDSGSSVEGFVADELGLWWSVSGGEFYYNLLINPGFKPNLSPIYMNSFGPYYDAEGNLVYGVSEDGFVDLVDNVEQPLFYSDGSSVSTENGFLRFTFLDSNNDSSTLRGNLNSVILSSYIITTTIPDNTWLQIGLKTTPPVGSTVADIIGDDISVPYGTGWVLYSYDTSTNTYKKLNLTDTMHSGVGYWFIQTTGNPVTIDMPDASTGVDVAHHPACPLIPSTKGCFEISLQTNPINAQWQMIGYPFRDYRNIDKLRIVTNSGACLIGCTLSQAQAEGLVSNTLWHYDGSSYQQLTDGGVDSFAPWDGAWIATLPAADGMALKLLIPATN